MIELRYFVDPKYPLLRTLQYRVKILWQWTDWTDVPVVEGEMDGTFRPSIRWPA